MMRHRLFAGCSAPAQRRCQRRLGRHRVRGRGGGRDRGSRRRSAAHVDGRCRRTRLQRQQQEATELCKHLLRSITPEHRRTMRAPRCPARQSWRRSVDVIRSHCQPRAQAHARQRGQTQRSDGSGSMCCGREAEAMRGEETERSLQSGAEPAESASRESQPPLRTGRPVRLPPHPTTHRHLVTTFVRLHCCC